MCLGMLCFLSLGIACAAYAASWGAPPDACAQADRHTGKYDVCDSVPLTATNSLQAVSSRTFFSFFHVHQGPLHVNFFIKVISFVEVGVLGAVLLVTIFSLRARPTTTVAYSVMTGQENS